MRWILYVVILALLFLAPLERADVAKLLPIETVAVYKQQEQVVLETDTKHKGIGQTVTKALEDLKKNTPAIVYLDTAKYAVISEAAMEELDALKGYLKDKIHIVVADVRGQVKEASRYLNAHGKLPENTSSQNDK